MESSRTFDERFKEHFKASSPTYEHQSNTGHNTTLEDFSLVGRERYNLARSIKESIYLEKTMPPYIGRYNLPHM